VSLAVERLDAKLASPEQQWGKGAAARTSRNQPRRLELAGAVSATGLQGNGFDCQLSASRQAALGNDIEAKPQSVGFNARSSPDLNHDPRDFTQALVSGAIDDEIDNALAQRQLVHQAFSSVYRSAQINPRVE
jgi:hypothetical protein